MTCATTYRTLDMHTAGEPVRIVIEGYPELAGPTILDRRRQAEAEQDHIRRLLMLEPRGHNDMYGVIPVAPSHPDADLAVLFMHTSGYSTMCGHATIAIGRWAVEAGLVPAAAPFLLECPCGLVEVTAELQAGRVASVSFLSVPSFAAMIGRELDVPGLGTLRVDISYGGAFYVILPASSLGLDLRTGPLGELLAAGTLITTAARHTLPVRHPSEPDLGFIYGTILTDHEQPASGRPSSNLCVFADGQIDRSPTGSGVTARMALDFAKGRVGVGGSRTFQGVTGVPFHASIDSADAEGGMRVRVTGQAHYTGLSEFRFEEGDPLKDGFLLDPTRPAFGFRQ